MNAITHNFLTGVKSMSICAAAFATMSAHAAETQEKSNEDISKSLTTILEQASEQGFVELEIQSLDANPETETPERVEEIEKPVVLPESRDRLLDCKIASIGNLEPYNEVVSYDDIAKSKAAIASYDSLDDRLPLIQTYWSLGLGTEAIALARPFDESRVALIVAISKTITGEAGSSDKSVLGKLAECSASASLWNKVANVDPEFGSFLTTLTPSDLELLGRYPPGLQRMLTLRLAVNLAETGRVDAALKALEVLEPQVKKGRLPSIRDDETMYLLALIELRAGKLRGKKIIEHLAMYDGPMRTKALSSLSKQNRVSGDKPYAGFSDDLKSVSHQYSGTFVSRQAVIQNINLLLQNGAIIDSIKTVKQDLGDFNSEQQEIIESIGGHVLTGLDDQRDEARLSALNAYLYDTSFYLPYSLLSDLKESALDTAVALQLPELHQQIFDEVSKEDLSTPQKKKLHLAQFDEALKYGDLKSAETVAGKYQGDTDVQNKLIEAVSLSGDKLGALKLIQQLPPSHHKSIFQAELEWRAGNFDAAITTINSVGNSPDKSGLQAKRQLAGFIASEREHSIQSLIPNTAAQLDQLESNFAENIRLVKGYLTNG